MPIKTLNLPMEYIAELIVVCESASNACPFTEGMSVIRKAADLYRRIEEYSESVCDDRERNRKEAERAALKGLINRDSWEAPRS